MRTRLVWRVAPDYRPPIQAQSQALTTVAWRWRANLRASTAGRTRTGLRAWRKAALEAPNNADIMNSAWHGRSGSGLWQHGRGSASRAVARSARAAVITLGYASTLDGRTDEAKDVLREAHWCSIRTSSGTGNLTRVDPGRAQCKPARNIARTSATS